MGVVPLATELFARHTENSVTRLPAADGSEFFIGHPRMFINRVHYLT